MEILYKNLSYICGKLQLMRKSLAVLTIFLSVFLYSQGTNNRFSDEESQAKDQSEYNSSGKGINYGDTKDDIAAINAGDPNPGDPVPIDQYVGLLLLTAVGFMFYTVKKKKESIS